MSYFVAVISYLFQLNDIDFQDSVMTLGFRTELSQELLQLYKQVRNSTLCMQWMQTSSSYSVITIGSKIHSWFINLHLCSNHFVRNAKYPPIIAVKAYPPQKCHDIWSQTYRTSAPKQAFRVISVCMHVCVCGGGGGGRSTSPNLLATPLIYFNILYKHQHRTAMNPFLNETKNGNVDSTCKQSFAGAIFEIYYSKSQFFEWIRRLLYAIYS